MADWLSELEKHFRRIVKPRISATVCGWKCARPHDLLGPTGFGHTPKEAYDLWKAQVDMGVIRCTGMKDVRYG